MNKIYSIHVTGMYRNIINASHTFTCTCTVPQQTILTALSAHANTQQLIYSIVVYTHISHCSVCTSHDTILYMQAYTHQAWVKYIEYLYLVVFKYFFSVFVFVFVFEC